jgi:hypothetical protein
MKDSEKAGKGEKDEKKAFQPCHWPYLVIQSPITIVAALFVAGWQSDRQMIGHGYCCRVKTRGQAFFGSSFSFVPGNQNRVTIRLPRSLDLEEKMNLSGCGWGGRQKKVASSGSGCRFRLIMWFSGKGTWP